MVHLSYFPAFSFSLLHSILPSLFYQVPHIQFGQSAAITNLGLHKSNAAPYYASPKHHFKACYPLDNLDMLAFVPESRMLALDCLIDVFGEDTMLFFGLFSEEVSRARKQQGMIIQLMFHPEQFRNAISSGQGDSFHQVIKRLIYAVQQKEQLYALRIVEEISAMLRSQSQSPVLKFKVAKVIMYIILLAQPNLLNQFAQKIYPPIKNACLFNRSQPIITRGMDFFKNNKYYEIANFQEKSKLKNIGCRYVVFCLQCVYMLAQWLPKDQQSGKTSLFLSSYQMLMKEGVEFPNPSDFTFFTEERIKGIQQQLEQCQQEATKIKNRDDEQYFESGKSRFDAANMNGVEYLQKRLKEKDKIIKEMRNNGSVHQLQKHSALEKIKQQERDNLEKIQAYEEKVANLTQQVREMKHLIKLENAPSPHPTDKIEELEAKVNLLAYENSRLKEELGKKSSFLSQKTNREENSQTVSLARVQSLQHIRQLIEITKQPHQTFLSHQTQKKPYPVELSNGKTLKQLFYPIFDALSRQSQIRLRKCLLKSKEILYKSKVLQLGIISALKGDIQLEITVIITNLAEETLSIQGVSFQSTRDLTITTLSNASAKKLKPGEQIKIEVLAEINHLDTKCLTFLISYYLRGGALEEVPLIMPLCRIKLLKYLNYSSFKDSQHSKLMREIGIQRRVVSNMDKLKNYIPKCFVQKHIQSEEFCYKVQFLAHIFYIKLQPLLDNRLLIKIYFKQAHRLLAQKILDDLTFILAT